MKLVFMWALWTSNGVAEVPHAYFPDQSACEQTKLVLPGKCVPAYYNAEAAKPLAPAVKPVQGVKRT